MVIVVSLAVFATAGHFVVTVVGKIEVALAGAQSLTLHPQSTLCGARESPRMAPWDAVRESPQTRELAAQMRRRGPATGATLQTPVKQYRKQHRSEPRRTANALFSFVRFTTT